MVDLEGRHLSWQRGGFKNTCSGLLQMQLNRAKLALAQKLLEAGHISDDDMKKVVGSMRQAPGLH